MSRRAELLTLLTSDVLAFVGAFFLLVYGAGRWAALDPVWMADPGTLLITAVGLAAIWLVLFVFAGMYRERFAESRFDELVTLGKVATLGALVLFGVYFVDRMEPADARLAAVLYWGSILLVSGGGRVLVRSFQKARILRGHGLHKAVIVGWSDQVARVYHEVKQYPAAGLRIVGAVRLLAEQPHLYGVEVPVGVDITDTSFSGDGGPFRSLPQLPNFDPDGLSEDEHSIDALPALIDRLGVQDVLIALGPGDHAFLDDVLRVCDGKMVNGRPLALKLVPDFYAAVGGMARTEHTYGLPLIEVLPTPIPAWERHTKRLVDIVTSGAILLLGLPIWLALAAAVGFSSAGPVIYRQERVGRNGRVFTMFKFRTMVDGAEKTTGPVWALVADQRVTPLGQWLRRLRLDELPQLLNVLRGDMSLVGPRPERPFFVRQLTEAIPLYGRRHRVTPGITGLAQVKQGYDADIEDVRQKLKYDLFYIEHMSLRMDFKILLQTLRTTLLGHGR